MITLSNGHRFEYMAASGALAFDGRGWPWEWPLRWLGILDPRLFTVVIKSLTREPRKGNLRWWNPFRCVRLLRHGVVNAVGLTNPGIDWWCQHIGPQVDRLPYKLVGSLYSTRSEELAIMAQMLDPFPLAAIELNCSCPNSHEAVAGESTAVVASVDAVRAATRHPIIVKLSLTHDLPVLVAQLEGRVEAIAINAVPWQMAFPHRTSPLAHFGGGAVSGRVAQVHTWKMLEELTAFTETPIIGPGVWDYSDIGKLRALGAKAISFGSIFLRAPWRPSAFVRRDMCDHVG